MVLKVQGVRGSGSRLQGLGFRVKGFGGFTDSG